jgi:hypothetical protein
MVVGFLSGHIEGFAMKRTFSRFSGVGVAGLSILILTVGPSLAGIPVPAPLIGVTGPVGLVVAGTAYGGYLLFKRFSNRD